MNATLVTLLVGGGAAGLLGFVAQMVKGFRQDKQWRELIAALRIDLHDSRDELKNCATERASLRKEVEGYRSEVIALRQQAQLEGWGVVKQ